MIPVIVIPRTLLDNICFDELELNVKECRTEIIDDYKIPSITFSETLNDDSRCLSITYRKLCLLCPSLNVNVSNVTYDILI